VRPRVIVHSLEHALAALQAAEERNIAVTLASASGAGAFAGPRWFLAVLAEAARAHPRATCDAVIDCADEPGTAMAALRAGAKRIAFAGGGEAAGKLAEIAAAANAAIEARAEVTALDLLDERDPLAACRVYLGA
jgi:hypothetical protein